MCSLQWKRAVTVPVCKAPPACVPACNFTPAPAGINGNVLAIQGTPAALPFQRDQHRPLGQQLRGSRVQRLNEDGRYPSIISLKKKVTVIVFFRTPGSNMSDTPGTGKNVGRFFRKKGGCAHNAAIFKKNKQKFQGIHLSSPRTRTRTRPHSRQPMFCFFFTVGQ